MATKGGSKTRKSGLKIDTTDEVTKDLSRLVELVECEGVDIERVLKEAEKDET
jgi:hypothetical protein